VGSPPTAAEFIGRLPAEGAAALSDELLRDWERWAAHLLEAHISYPQLAYYRSQHINQSWLGSLTAILDSSALILAGLDALPTRQARLTFAMARHALVDITQIFVVAQPAAGPYRLPPATLHRLRGHLAGQPVHLPESPDFEQRLGAIRTKYEPYAGALADFLLIDLPPWVHAEPHRDNWQGGPWDKSLEARAAGEHRSDEHF
jgi:hypothetical protein